MNWVEVPPWTGPGTHWQSESEAKSGHWQALAACSTGKCEGPPSGATATVPHGTTSAASSRSSKARALWCREEAQAPVRGEEPRSVCKCEGPPSGATATVPRGTQSAASSRSSSKSKARAPGLWSREEALLGRHFAVTVATLSSLSPLCRHRRHFAFGLSNFLVIVFFALNSSSERGGGDCHSSQEYG